MSFAQIELLVKNRAGLHLEKAPVPYSVLERAVAEFKRLTDAAYAPRRCSCCQEFAGFEIDVSRDTPAYVAMERAAVERMWERV